MKTSIRITTVTPEGEICVFETDTFVAKVNVSGGDWTSFDGYPHGFRTTSGLVVPNGLLEAQLAAAIWRALQVGIVHTNVTLNVPSATPSLCTIARIKSVSRWDGAGVADLCAIVVETSRGEDSEGESWKDFVDGILAFVRATLSER